MSNEMSEEISNTLQFMSKEEPRAQLQKLADCSRVQERQDLMWHTDCGRILHDWDVKDATIATLQAQVAQLRAALEEIAGCRGNFGSGIKLKERALADLDALAREALKEKTDGKV